MKFHRLFLPIAAVCTFLVVSAAAFVLFGQNDEARFAVLEREVKSLREALRNQARESAYSGALQPPTQELASTAQSAVNTSELPGRVASLGATVAQLEQAVRTFNERINRAKLAPTPEQQAAVLTRLLAETPQQLQKAQSTLAEAKRIAAQMNVQLDDNVLLNLGKATPLDNYPPFVEARIRAVQERQFSEALQIRHSEAYLKQSTADLGAMDPARRTSPAVARAQLNAEALNQAKRYYASMAEVRAIAARLNLSMEGRAFTDYKFDPKISNQPEFTDARANMFQNQRILRAVQERYIEQLADPDQNL